MTFDEWTTEAHRSLAAWTPDPPVRPVAAGLDAADPSTPEPAATPVDLDLFAVHDRRAPSTSRRLLAAAAAAAVVAAVALAAVALPSGDTDVAVGPRTETTQPAASEPSETSASSDPVATSAPVTASPTAPMFDCMAADDGGAPTTVFDDSPDVAQWGVDDLSSVRGTLTEVPGEDVAGTAGRGATLLSAAAPAWRCTLWSPEVDVADPSQAGPAVVDDHVTNRMGGMCAVPDETAVPGSVWGVDPALATALDHVDGLTGWSVILADTAGNDLGAGLTWMEFTFEAEVSAGENGLTNGVLAGVTAAVDTAGIAAGIPTRCSVH